MGNKELNTILLVEDEVLIAILEKKILESYGYTIIIANTGEDAVEQVRSCHTLDLILMDINLGSGIDGTIAAEMILKNYDIPLIFLSSHTEREIVEKTEGITSYGYIVKNSGETVLIASIKMAFRLFEEKVRVREQQQQLYAANEELEQTNEELIAANDDLGKSQAEILEHELVLLKNEEMYRALVEGMPDVVERFDREFRHLYVSENIKNLFDRDRHFCLGKSHREMGISPDECQFWEQSIRKVLETKNSFSTDFTHQSTRGDTIFECRFIPEFDFRGEVQSVLLLSRDITENIQLKREYENLFYKMIDGFALHEIICDEHGKPINYRFLDINPAFEQLTGLLEKDILGKLVLDVLPDLEPYWIELYGNVALTGEPISFENFTGTLGKHYRVTAYRPAVNQFACIFIDITERKRIEMALNESENRFKKVIETMPVMMSIFDSQWNIIAWNSECEHVTGYHADEMVGNPNALELLYPNSEEREDMIRFILENRTDFRDKEFSITCKDGTQKTISWSDNSARVSIPGWYIWAFGKDITEQKEALAALRQNEKLFEEVFDNLTSGVAIYRAVDQGNDFVFVGFNKASEQIEQKRKEEVIGRRVTEVFPGVKEFGIFDVFKKVWETGESMYHPITFYKDQRIHGWRENRVFKLPTGEVVAIYEDKTKEKQSEAENKRQLDEKELILKEVHHRIKNNLISIESLLVLQAQSHSEAPLHAILNETINRIRSIRLLNEKILISSNFQEISIRRYLDELIDLILSIFPERLKIRVEKHIDDFMMSSKLVFPFGIIVNELLTNIMKYAFTEVDSGSVLIVLSKQKDSPQVTLIVEDDGIGLPKNYDEDTNEGFGFMLIKILCQQIKGSFKAENIQKGTQCILQFNLPT